MDIELIGTLYECELTREDLIKDDISLQAIYDYQKTITDPKIAYHMEAVLRMASDNLCNTCHEMNIDPLTLEYLTMDSNLHLDF